HTSLSRDWSSDVCSSDLSWRSGLTGVEVLTHVLGHGRDVQRHTAGADRLRAEHAGRDRLTGRDRGDVGDAAVADEAEELARKAPIGRASCRGTGDASLG